MHDVLESPGSADLAADVDFAAVRRAALSEGEITIVYFDQRSLNYFLGMYNIEVGCHGPITQNEFLHKLGIRQRLEVRADWWYA